VPFAIIAHRRVKVKMRKLHIKHSSVLVEPANRPTEIFVGARSSRPSTKTPMLEILGEIACLLASSIVGWIAYVAF